MSLLAVSCDREVGAGASDLLIGTLKLLTATKATIVARIVKKQFVQSHAALPTCSLSCELPWRPSGIIVRGRRGDVFSEISKEEIDRALREMRSRWAMSYGLVEVG